MKHSEDDQQNLGKLLTQWKVSTNEDPSFRSSVWSQIELSEAALEQSFLGRFQSRLERFFSNTSALLSAGFSMVSLSLGLAHFHAQSSLEDRRQVAEAEYLETIYPVFSPTTSRP